MCKVLLFILNWRIKKKTVLKYVNVVLKHLSKVLLLPFKFFPIFLLRWSAVIVPLLCCNF